VIYLDYDGERIEIWRNENIIKSIDVSDNGESVLLERQNFLNLVDTINEILDDVGEVIEKHIKYTDCFIIEG